MPKFITLGIKRADGDAVILKQPSVSLTEQRAYLDSIQDYDPTYAKMIIFDLENIEKESILSAEVALTVAANNKSITYGDSKPTFTATYSVTPTSGDISGTLAYECSYKKGDAAGTYVVTPKGISSDKYGISFVAGTLTVAKKALTITAENKSMTAGDTAPEFTVTATGFITGDDISDGTGSIAFDILDANDDPVADVAAAAAGTYKIVPKGLTFANYEVSYVAGALTIEAAEQSGTD